MREIIIILLRGAMQDGRLRHVKVDRACGLEFAIASDRAKLQLVGKVVGHLGEKTELLILSGGIQVDTNLEGVFLCTDIADQIVNVSDRRVRRDPVLEQEAVVDWEMG